MNQAVTQRQYLWDKLGKTIQAGLIDDQVTEITLNPDNTVWLTHRGQGNIIAGKLPTKEAQAFVNTLAQSCSQFLNENKPYLDAVLPFFGERINITIPNLTSNGINGKNERLSGSIENRKNLSKPTRRKWHQFGIPCYTTYE